MEQGNKPKYEPLKRFGTHAKEDDALSKSIRSKAEADRFIKDLKSLTKTFYTLEDMENAYNAGGKNAAQSASAVSKGKEPFLVRFVDWIKTYKTK